MNGVGHLDLIASSEVVEEGNYYYTAGNTISVAEGDGKGNFGLARIYGGNSEALYLAIGDFKGDGRPDIVTADADTDTATVLSNDGNDGYGFPQGIDACQTSQGAWICPKVVVNYGSGYTFADLNSDGKPDIFQIGLSGTSNYYSLSYLNDGTLRSICRDAIAFCNFLRRWIEQRGRRGAAKPIHCYGTGYGLRSHSLARSNRRNSQSLAAETSKSATVQRSLPFPDKTNVGRYQAASSSSSLSSGSAV